MILTVLLNAGIIIAAFAGMEFIAWFTHKYIMHGFLWVLHKDRHVPHKGKFELNDLFVLWFTAPAVLAFIFGIRNTIWPLISLGIGITLYGISYTLFHDVMFHRRIKWLKIPSKSPYFKRIINAHRAHHKTTKQYPTEAFGFLWAPKRYEEKTRQ
ncbi:MAG: sterol desaturase family protein [Salinispira sp.]